MNIPRMIESRSSATVVALGVVLALTAVVRPAAAQQQVLAAGTLHENLNTTVSHTALASPPDGFVVRRTSDGAPPDENIRLFASMIRPLSSGTGKVSSHFLFDFCVPRAGMLTCDPTTAPEPSPASDINATISFNYGYMGSLYAQFFGTARLKVEAYLINRRTNSNVWYAPLADVKAEPGLNAKGVAGVPVPMPEIDFDTTTAPVAFTVPLRRGRAYRVQLSFRAEASRSPLNFFGVIGGGIVNFGEGLADLQHPLLKGFLSISNLTIDVASELTTTDLRITNLEDSLDKLSDRMGELVKLIDTVEDDYKKADTTLGGEALAALQAIQLQPGPAGPEGPMGPVGPEGPAGAQGASGPAGPVGPQGLVGPQGDVGAVGAVGQTGPMGPIGMTGPTGPTGPQGEGLMIGSHLLMPAGGSPPPGYDFVGSFDLFPSGGSRGREALTSIDVYIRR